MQVNGYSICLLFHIFFKVLHHLIANSIAAIGLQYSKGENIGMLLFLIVLHSYGIGSNNDIIVEAELGELSVLKCNFDVEGCAILNGEGLKVNLSQQIDIFVVDIPKGDLDFGSVHAINGNLWLIYKLN